MAPSSEPSLGRRLREVRALRGMSLRAVAEPAGISPAYLQKLERDDVESPSPHALHGLAEVLDTPYIELLALAGYPLPDRQQRSRGPALIADGRSREPLDAEEAQQLSEYLAFLRHRRRSGAGT